MKQVALVAVAFLLGIVVGGIPPRAELREISKRQDALQAELRRSTLGADLASLFGAGHAPGAATGATGSAPPADGGVPAPRRPDQIVAEQPEAQRAADELREAQWAAEDQVKKGFQEGPSDEELDLARAALELRRAQARAALEEDADPEREQLDAIDAAAGAMNRKLLSMADELVAMVNDGSPPDRREAMEFAADALDTMLEAEDRMSSALSAEQRAGIDPESLDPFAWVDPALVDAFAKLDAAAGRTAGEP